MATTVQTARPRNVNMWRAAAILYGDLGTSKAYVLGLAFALAAYSSFWYIFAVGLLTLLVGINYTTICRLFPNGGGVYSTARARSKALSLVGAFFLIADYLVTAALSSLSAFNYLGVAYPEIWAVAAILFIGLLNFLGPKHTGSMAIALALPTLLIVFLLGLISLPFLPAAIKNLSWVSGDIGLDWKIFVGVIVALSGIESIANTTNSMKLDPGSSYANPRIKKTSTWAILFVVAEVCVFTSLFGLVMNALPGLEISNHEVSAPGYPNVRDAMMRYMGEVFAGEYFGQAVGQFFGLVISVVIGLLLLSAVNTAMIALISLLYIMSKDEELPGYFQKLNRFGVPIYPTVLMMVVPSLLILAVSDVLGLANLYAIGFVGAIAVNLGATSTNYNLSMKLWERYLMLGTFFIMLLVETTLFIDKPQARGFVVAIMGIGLLLRTMLKEQKEKKAVEAPVKSSLPQMPAEEEGKDAAMVVVTGLSKSLDYALEMTKKYSIPLYILFVREQRVLTEADKNRQWLEDQGACDVFDYVLDICHERQLGFLYTVTSHTAFSISEVAKQKKVKRIIIDQVRGKYTFINAIRGTTARDISNQIPANIDLIAIY